MTGSIVLATNQGLGYLAKSFFDHGLIQKVVVKHHSSRENHYDWYPDDARVTTEELLEQCDTLIFFEEVWDWRIIVRARERGIRTVLIPMYECTQNPLPYQPDLIIAPSLLDQDYFEGSTFLPIPVDVPWRLRKKAEVFVHNAGNGGLGGRNGTREVLEAMQYVKSPLKLILRSQVPIKQVEDSRIEYRIGQFENIWEEGDVFLFPEKFNGLSMPISEGYASGMLMMCGDRYPINTFLPKEPLIPVDHYTTERISVQFDCAHYDPKTIAQTMDSWYNRDIQAFSLLGKDWGEQNSWKALIEKYRELL